MAYDSINIFAKILRMEIPCQKLYEDSYALAFYDIYPKAPVHILIIPKGAYTDAADFAARASEAEIVGFTRALGQVMALAPIGESGFRLISNTGLHGGQEVPHYHIHLLAGKALGPMIVEKG